MSLKINIRKPKEIGVFISYEEPYHYVDEFSFDSEREVAEFIQKNIGEGHFIVYEYVKKEGALIFNPILSGDKDDL